jgi:hypothetical protein
MMLDYPTRFCLRFTEPSQTAIQRLDSPRRPT